jgi:hypothetical protein
LGDGFGVKEKKREARAEKKGEVLGFKFLGFLGDGFGVKEKKKREAQADCVRPSRAPTLDIKNHKWLL